MVPTTGQESLPQKAASGLPFRAEEEYTQARVRGVLRTREGNQQLAAGSLGKLSDTCAVFSNVNTKLSGLTQTKQTVRTPWTLGHCQVPPTHFSASELPNGKGRSTTEHRSLSWRKPSLAQLHTLPSAPYAHLQGSPLSPRSRR